MASPTFFGAEEWFQDQALVFLFHCCLKLVICACKNVLVYSNIYLCIYIYIHHVVYIYIYIMLCIYIYTSCCIYIYIYCRPTYMYICLSSWVYLVNPHHILIKFWCFPPRKSNWPIQKMSLNPSPRFPTATTPGLCSHSSAASQVKRAFYPTSVFLRGEQKMEDSLESIFRGPPLPFGGILCKSCFQLILNPPLQIRMIHIGNRCVTMLFPSFSHFPMFLFINFAKNCQAFYIISLCPQKVIRGNPQTFGRGLSFGRFRISTDTWKITQCKKTCDKNLVDFKI